MRRADTKSPANAGARSAWHAWCTRAGMLEDACSPSGARYYAGEMVDDKYDLIELLGTGGMGSVWRARDCLLDIDVALKLIRPREACAGALERVLSEGA